MDHNTVYLTLSPDTADIAGCDCTEMLMLMYHEYSPKIRTTIEQFYWEWGEYTGTKECLMKLGGHEIYDKLISERGWHVFEGTFLNQRKQARVHVDVIPDLLNFSEDAVNKNDFSSEVYRRYGAEGQHINSVRALVRVTHKPTQTTVLCNKERSEWKNKKAALRLVVAKIEHEKKLGKTGWLDIVRTYVLDPVPLVTDCKTGKTTDRVKDVLAGELDLVRGENE